MKKMSGRRFNKVIIAALVVVIAYALTFPAYSAGPPPATGDLYIHKFVGATESDDSDGTEINTSAWDAIPANNVVFDLYEVGAAETHTPEWPEVPPIGAYSIDGGKLVVTNGGVTAGEYALNPAGYIVTGDSGTAGVAIAENLPRGIYLVVENAAASKLLGVEDPSGNPVSIIEAIAPFLVAVPMTNVNGTGWIQAVHVYPKNREMSISKAVETESGTIAVGDTVTYTLTFTLPGDVDTGKSVEITDKLDSALTLDPESVAVTTIVARTLTKETDGDGDYTVTYEEDELTVSFTTGTTGGIKKLEGLTSVIVTFDCIINSRILSYGDFTISNTATVEFTNEYDISYSSTTEEQVDVHTAAIRVVKYAGNGAALSDAKFKIASSATNAADGHFIRKNDVTGELVDYDPLPTSEWYSLGATSDYEGTAVANVTTFYGLRDVVDDVYQTYYIVETRAPSGYNLLTSPREVTFTGDEDNYTLVVSVTNYSGFTLPQTGGIGTIVWTVSGIVLLGAAIIIVATKKKQPE